MIPKERAITIARMIHEQSEDLSHLFDRDEREAARQMWRYYDDRECSCADEPDATCWYHMTDEQQIESMAWMVSR